jgi:uncharacterized YccA/Bax inhibitor family protein
MALNNPGLNTGAFARGGVGVARMPQQAASVEELNELYAKPSATSQDADRMSYDDTITKTATVFVVLLIGAAVGWIIPQLMWVGLIAGFVLAMVNIFKKEPSAPLVFAYAAAEGVFLGGISMMLEAIYPSIVLQAVMGTLIVFATVLLLFRSGKVRASAKATRIFMIAGFSYLAFSLVNVVLMLTGVSTDPWGLRTGIEIAGIPLGVIIGLFAIVLASYSLVMDFDYIQRGVENGAPRKFGWRAAFGLTLTLVWLYLEIIRLLAILRGGD